MRKCSFKIFKCVTRPVLTNDNLIEYGIENEDDLEFFRKLNEFKDSLYSEDVKFYDRSTVSAAKIGRASCRERV